MGIVRPLETLTQIKMEQSSTGSRTCDCGLTLCSTKLTCCFSGVRGAGRKYKGKCQATQVVAGRSSRPEAGGVLAGAGSTGASGASMQQQETAWTWQHFIWQLFASSACATSMVAGNACTRSAKMRMMDLNISYDSYNTQNGQSHPMLR